MYTQQLKLIFRRFGFSNPVDLGYVKMNVINDMAKCVLSIGDLIVCYFIDIGTKFHKALVVFQSADWMKASAWANQRIYTILQLYKNL